MIDRFLERGVLFAKSHPRFLWAFLGLSLLFSSYALTVPLDFSFSGVMNRSHPEVARYFAASEAYGLGGILPLLVEGPEAGLDRAVADVRAVLESLPEVRSTDRDPPADWVRTRAPWLVDREDFDAWVEEASGPLGPSPSVAAEERVKRLGERFKAVKPEGARLIRIVMARDTFEMALDADDFPTIRRAVRDALAPHQAVGKFAGMPAIITQEQEATIERMTLLGPLSLFLVLGILWTVERRWMMLVSIAIPMILAVGCTLALVGLVEGELTLMESIFGVMVFGLGIDFALHLLLRLREERAHGHSFDESLRRAFVGTGRGVVAGAMTTAGAFFVLSFAPDPVFYRLGLSGGIGLSFCLLFLLLMLPAEWAWIDGLSEGGEVPPEPSRPSLLGRIAGGCQGKWRVVVLVSSALFLWAGFSMRSLSYETNLEKVFSRDIEAVDTARRIDSLFGIHSGVWVVARKDLEGARETAARFEADPIFESTESVAHLIPDDLEERRTILTEWATQHASEPASDHEGREVAGSGPGAEDRLQSSAFLLSALESGPPTIATLPASIRESLVGPGGEVLVLAYTRGATLDSAVAARERRAAQAIHPEATSMNAIYEALIGTDRPWLPPVMLAVAAFIAVIIRLDLGNFRRTVLALIPALFSVVGTLGLLALGGFSLNTVTLVSVPILLGLAVDDGIHVVHRMIEQPQASIEETMGSVARSIALTTATTCGSVGLLLFSRHPGVESVAILLMVGLPLALLTTVTVMPAMAIALGVTHEE